MERSNTETARAVFVKCTKSKWQTLRLLLWEDVVQPEPYQRELLENELWFMWPDVSVH
jgi:hypothetical protein